MATCRVRGSISHAWHQMSARQYIGLGGHIRRCAVHINARHHGCAAAYKFAAERRVRGNTGARQHTGARHHGVSGTMQRRRDHLAALAAPWRVATCKQYGHEMRGTIRRENPRKQGCAAAWRVRGNMTSARRHDERAVPEPATNETPRAPAIHKKIIYVCNRSADVTLRLYSSNTTSIS